MRVAAARGGLARAPAGPDVDRLGGRRLHADAHDRDGYLRGDVTEPAPEQPAIHALPRGENCCTAHEDDSVSRSLDFDGAAEFYDETRVTDEETLRDVVDLLERDSRPGTVRCSRSAWGPGSWPCRSRHAVSGSSASTCRGDDGAKLREKAAGVRSAPARQADATRTPVPRRGVRRRVRPLGAPPDPGVARRRRRALPGRRPGGVVADRTGRQPGPLARGLDAVPGDPAAT